MEEEVKPVEEVVEKESTGINMQGQEVPISESLATPEVVEPEVV